MFKFVNLFLMIFLLITIEILGQGAITGVVSDSATEEALYGANVFLTGTAFGSSTNIEGKYKISQVPVGKYNLKVSYIGFIPKEYTVTVMENKTLEIDVKLKTSVIQGSEVVISGQALGQAAAINQQLSSNTIVNIVSEEKIQELPDANAAEAIGRLPGVAIQRSGGEASKIVLRGLDSRFSTVTVDGVQIAPTDAQDRGTDLSMISQSSLAGIELFKALTPDQDADAIAGTVDLITKKAPSKRTITVEAQGIYNKLENSLNQYNFWLRYGERFFNNILGVQIDGNLEQVIRSDESDNINYNTIINNGTDYRITTFSLDYVNELRKRNGISFLLDINTPDNGSIRINNIYDKTSRNYTDNNRLYPTNGIGNTIYGLRTTNKDLSMLNSSITGDNHLFDFDINWGLSLAQSTSRYPYDYGVSFDESTNIVNGVYISGMRNIPSSLLHGPPETLIPYAVDNFHDAILQNGNYYNQNSFQKNRSAFINFSKEYSLSDLFTGKLKFGAKYKRTDRSRNSVQLDCPYYNIEFPQYVVTPNGSVVKKNLAGTDFNNIIYAGGRISLENFLVNSINSRSLFDLYNLTPLIDVNLVKEWYDINKNGKEGSMLSSPDEYQHDGSSIMDYYDLVEKINAGYIMNTINIGEFVTFLAGIRVESEHNTYKSRYSLVSIQGISFDRSAIKDTTCSYDETIWLPNFQFIIKPSKSIHVRLAAYKALARPDFNYRLSKYYDIQGSIPSVQMANPKLKDAEAWNYEINTSFFGNRIGLITLSAYYKVIKDMYHVTNGIEIDGINNGYSPSLSTLGVVLPIPYSNVYLTYPYNSDKNTRVWGFELDHQINFLFLPGFLKNFVLSYNISINRSMTYLYGTKLIVTGTGVHQRVTTVLADNKNKLENQPDLMGNVSLGYDIDGFSLRVSVFSQDSYVTNYDPAGFDNTVENAFTKCDIALKQNINDKIAVLFNINNLTDYHEGNHLYDTMHGWNLPLYQIRYGMSADLGIKVGL